MQMADEEGLDKDIIIVTDESFSEGIVGLAASRLAEHYYRPAIVGRSWH